VGLHITHSYVTYGLRKAPAPFSAFVSEQLFFGTIEHLQPQDCTLELNNKRMCLQVVYDDAYDSTELSELVFTAEANTGYYLFLTETINYGTCGKVDLQFSAVTPGRMIHSTFHYLLL